LENTSAAISRPNAAPPRSAWIDNWSKPHAATCGCWVAAAGARLVLEVLGADLDAVISAGVLAGVDAAADVDNGALPLVGTLRLAGGLVDAAAEADMGALDRSPLAGEVHAVRMSAAAPARTALALRRLNSRSAGRSSRAGSRS
jgi:hypothetical protein